METKRDFPPGSWIVPTLLILANVVWGFRIGTSGGGMDKLAEVLLFVIFMVPNSVLFLLIYGLVLYRLRTSPRPRGAVVTLALATLAGAGACATGAALIMLLWRLEASH
uniref:Uncharacterized protein n=1 Tax=Chondromyces catenulatus TaxID=1653841 RepID=A0A3S5GY15_9BACT|nr:hypothetical protein [Chondromyces catenulatus]